MTVIKLGYFEKRKREAQEAVGYSKIDYAGYIRIMIFLATGGFVLGIYFNNLAMSFILAFGFTYIPYQVVQFKRNGNIITINERLEPAMNTVTNSYLQNGDLIKSVQEALDGIDDPVIKGVFTQFLTDTDYNMNVKKAIVKMRDSIDNPLFREWCDALIPCQDDSGLKHTLPAVLEKMSDIRKQQYELDTAMMKVWRDYIAVVAIVIANVPLMRLINKEWYLFLVDTLPGKSIMAVSCVVIMASTAYVIRENKPVSVM